MAKMYPSTDSQPPSAELIVRQGPRPGQRFSLTKPTMIIGREADSDIVVNDPQVSRRHASLTWDGRQFIIQDLGSINGTLVNGVRLTAPRVLQQGDVIGLGPTVLLAFQALSPALAPGPPTKKRRGILILLIALLGLCCLLSAIGGLAYFFFWPQEEPTPIIIVATLTPTPLPQALTPIPPAPTAPPTPGISVDTGTSAQLIQPTDLVYLGAFRLPDVPGDDEHSWMWSNWASAMAYYPDGDPAGPADGYPGSIFGVGHDQTQYVSEINIPIPMISPGKNVSDLNTATTLQDFHDIRGHLFDPMEMPRVGLAYLSAQGAQITGKLYFAWAPHLDEGATNPSHGWAELDLARPNPAGPWRTGDYWNYVTGDYLLPIPRAWADAYTPGMYLATGRFRDGGQAAEGPSLFAIGPWNEGNPPAPGSTLSAIPLLLYGDVYTEGSPTVNGYHHSDEWSGGAWLTSGDKSAVIFVGTKGAGECWYGNPKGPCLDCEDRGWWSTGFEGQIIFYDPADLAAVARGEMETWEPQPYAMLNVDEYLYHIESGQQKHHVGAASFDRERGLLYVFEPLADGDKSLIHVWRVEG